MNMMRFNDFYLRFYDADPGDEGRALIDEFYALWCEAEAGGVDMVTLAREAEDCLHRIATTALFTTAACEWIGRHGHYSISKALTDQISIHYLQHPSLVRFALTTFSESSATAVASRLCALEAPIPVALGWVLSLDEDHPSGARDSITSIANFLASEYPATCKRLLEAEGSSFIDSKSAQEILGRLVFESRALDALPYLTELQMPSDMRRSLRYLRFRENRAIAEHAQAQSIFGLFTTAKHFKYANQVAIEYQNDAEIVDAMLPMLAHEMSMELPQTGVADPASFGRMKIAMWAVINQ